MLISFVECIPYWSYSLSKICSHRKWWVCERPCALCRRWPPCRCSHLTGEHSASGPWPPAPACRVPCPLRRWSCHTHASPWVTGNALVPCYVKNSPWFCFWRGFPPRSACWRSEAAPPHQAPTGGTASPRTRDTWQWSEDTYVRRNDSDWHSYENKDFRLVNSYHLMSSSAISAPVWTQLQVSSYQGWWPDSITPGPVSLTSARLVAHGSPEAEGRLGKRKIEMLQTSDMMQCVIIIHSMQCWLLFHRRISISLIFCVTIEDPGIK